MVLVANRDGITARMGVIHSLLEVYDGAKHQFRIDLTGTGQILHFLRFQASLGPWAFGGQVSFSSS